MGNLRNIEMRSALARASRVVLLPLLLASGCSGDGGGGGGLLSSITTNLAEGGIGGTGITSGPISAFGSVFVNGVEFQSDSATILLNGEPATEAELGLGMIVRVEGTIDSDGKNGTATHIEFRDNVRGLVEKIDPEKRRLAVLRQNVVVDNLTIFEGFESLSSLRVGTMAEVSGYVDVRGSVHATRISAIQAAARRSLVEVDPGARFDVTGTVSEVDAAAQKFFIGRLPIDYSRTAVLDTVPENGQQVNVRGVLPFLQLTMQADSVTTVEAAAGRTGDEVQVSGLISRYISPQNFEVTGLDVTSTDNTIYRFGSVLDLATGARVEVEGRIDETGRLAARRITYGDKTSARGAAGEIALRASVQGVDNESRSVTLLGREARTDNTTQFSDQRDRVLRFGIPELSIGDEVLVLGFLDAQTGELVAERLERVIGDGTAQAMVSGPSNHVDLANGSLQVAGLLVSIDGTTHITDAGGTALTTDQLTEALSRNPEATVRARGVDTGTGILALTIEFPMSASAPAQN